VGAVPPRCWPVHVVKGLLAADCHQLAQSTSGAAPLDSNHSALIQFTERQGTSVIGSCVECTVRLTQAAPLEPTLEDTRARTPCLHSRLGPPTGCTWRALRVSTRRVVVLSIPSQRRLPNYRSVRDACRGRQPTSTPRDHCGGARGWGGAGLQCLRGGTWVFFIANPRDNGRRPPLRAVSSLLARPRPPPYPPRLVPAQALVLRTLIPFVTLQPGQTEPPRPATRCTGRPHFRPRWASCQALSQGGTRSTRWPNHRRLSSRSMGRRPACLQSHFTSMTVPDPLRYPLCRTFIASFTGHRLPPGHCIPTGDVPPVIVPPHRPFHAHLRTTSSHLRLCAER